MRLQSPGNALSMLLTIAAMMMMRRCVYQQLFSSHPRLHRDGCTPLMEAAREGHDATVRLLLECKADVNAATIQ